MGQHKEIPRTAHTTARGISSYTYLDNRLSRKRCFRIQKTLLFGVLKHEKPQPRMRHAHALLEGMGHLCPRYAHASSPDIPCLSPTYAHASPPSKHSLKHTFGISTYQSGISLYSSSSAYFRAEVPPITSAPAIPRQTHAFLYVFQTNSFLNVSHFPNISLRYSLISYIY